MQLAATKPAPQKVRCRQIAQADLGQLAVLLARGFPATQTGYWTKGFERFADLPAIEGVARFGYVLESEAGIVGVILLISSLRGGQIFSNLSSWYVEPDFRAHSTSLISMATKHKHVTYLNISPAQHTWRTLEAQGFKPYNLGRSAVFPAMNRGAGTVSEIIPRDLPEYELLRAHAAYGCRSVVCELDGAILPFVFKPRRLDRPPVRMTELIFSRDADAFARCAPALGRWMLRRGALGIICDGRVKGFPSRYVAGKEPRFFKGPRVPTDLAFTEKVIFG